MFARSGEAGRRRPKVVIAHSDPAYAGAVGHAFRRHGWGVALAADGPQARQFAARLEPELIVLGTALPGESGWLTCAKLTGEAPRPKVVLVADEVTPSDEEFADFAGAARLVAAGEGADPLLEEAGVVVAAA